MQFKSRQVSEIRQKSVGEKRESFLSVDDISNRVPLPLLRRARTNSLNEARLDHDALSKVREQKTKDVEDSSTDVVESVLAET